MLDTGASRSIILRSAADRLGLVRHNARGNRMIGIGGETDVESVSVDEFEIGTDVRRSWRILVAGEQTFRATSRSSWAKISSASRRRIRSCPQRGQAVSGQGLRRRAARVLGDRRGGRCRARWNLRGGPGTRARGRDQWPSGRRDTRFRRVVVGADQVAAAALGVTPAARASLLGDAAGVSARSRSKSGSARSRASASATSSSGIPRSVSPISGSSRPTAQRAV